jgi:hypothetical protein
MFTICLIALVVIAWFAYSFQVRSTQVKLQQTQQHQFDIAHWRKIAEIGDSTVERVLSFPHMYMVTEVTNFSDGGYLADMYLQKKESWEKDEEDLKSDGWTKEEWMAHGVQQYDIRRQPDGTWQGRRVWKQWKRDVKKAMDPSWPQRDSVKNLTGISYDEWRERGDFYDDTLRPWETITEDAPSIEASYQRFIHAT